MKKDVFTKREKANKTSKDRLQTFVLYPNNTIKNAKPKQEKKNKEKNIRNRRTKTNLYTKFNLEEKVATATHTHTDRQTDRHTDKHRTHCKVIFHPFLFC